MREHLRAEIVRLRDAGPREALGLPPAAGEAEARQAFRDLAKRYHPARFARRQRDVVKLSNEVFLCLREAHESLVQGRGRRPRGSAGPDRRPPVAERASRQAGRAASSEVKGADASAGASAGRDEERERAARAARAARVARQLGYGPRRAGDNSHAKGADAAAQRAAEGEGSGGRAGAGDSSAPTPAGAGETSAKRTKATIDTLLASARTEAERAHEAFRTAAAILDARDAERVAEARATLQALAASHPQDRSYRAHFHCALALERAGAGRIADARAELDRALSLDPQLGRALELRRELTRGRRLFSRLRKR